MFRNLLRARMPIPGTAVRCWVRRDLSHVSVHSGFPATLYRFQVHRESKLFDKKLEQDDWEWEDGIQIADDGLVYPKITLNGMLLLYVSVVICYSRPYRFKRGFIYAKYPLHARDNSKVF
jgi:hypothetical protein